FVFTSPCSGQPPEKIFAPYVDVLLYPAFSINNAFDRTGQPYYTLAFITADTDCKPAWGGVIALEENHYMEYPCFHHCRYRLQTRLGRRDRSGRKPLYG
ncbi:MAG: hypothetical protein B6240_03605, partial [Desulfobacteraceae bacterium 4572_87]